jgi:hypothetical protein
MEFEIDNFILNEDSYEDTINLNSAIKELVLETIIKKTDSINNLYWSTKVGNFKIIKTQLILFKLCNKRNASKKSICLR